MSFRQTPCRVNLATDSGLHHMTSPVTLPLSVYFNRYTKLSVYAAFTDGGLLQVRRTPPCDRHNKSLFQCMHTLTYICTHLHHLQQDAVDDILLGKLQPSDFPQMRVVQHRGVWYSLDNRRLWVFKAAQVRHSDTLCFANI